MFRRPLPEKEFSLLVRVGAYHAGLILLVSFLLLTILPSAALSDESRALSSGDARDTAPTPISSFEEFLGLLHLDYEVHPGEDRLEDFSGEGEVMQVAAQGITEDSPSVIDQYPKGHGEPQDEPTAKSAEGWTYWRTTGEVTRIRRPDESYQFPDRTSIQSGDDLFRLLDMDIEYERRPEFLPAKDSLADAPGRSVVSVALQRLAKKEFCRHTRRYLKKHWRRQFGEAVGMNYEFYQARLTQIDHIGKDPEEFDPFNTDYYLNEARGTTLGEEEHEGEPEIALVRYGPFIFKDNGSIEFSLRSMVNFGSNDFSNVHLDPDSDSHSRPEPALFSGDHIKIKPGFKVKIDPLRGFSGDVEKMLRSYGASIDVKFYSDILGKKMFATELETKFSHGGDFAFFFNFVIQERS